VLGVDIDVERRDTEHEEGVLTQAMGKLVDVFDVLCDPLVLSLPLALHRGIFVVGRVSHRVLNSRSRAYIQRDLKACGSNFYG
jgi:hypothetical protein